MSQPIIEACTENLQESIYAEQNSANRIELCDNLTIGGTTPSYGTIKQTIESINIPVFVMIRMNAGFTCTHKEFLAMLDDIKICVDLNAAGVVFGILNDAGAIDYQRMEKLTLAAGSLNIICHRVIDEIEKPWLELPNLKSIGISHILSAGGHGTVFDGKNTLSKLYESCCDNNIKLTAAGKITTDNLSQVKQEITAHAYHGRAIVNLGK